MENLQQSWKNTEKQLRLAMAQLHDTEEVKEYLEHNELGLAWESLAEIADRQGVISADFWRPMAKAAGIMANLVGGDVS